MEGRSARSREEFQRKVHEYPIKHGIDTTPQEIAEKHKIAQRIAKSSISRKENLLYEAEIIAKRIGLPSYSIEEVKEILAKLQRQGILKGKNRKAVISSVIYFVSSTSNNINVSFKTLAETIGVPESKIRKIYRHMVMNGFIKRKTTKTTKPSKFISQILSSNEYLQMKSHLNLSLLTKFADEMGSLLHGKKPRGIAAASVYIFSSMLGFKHPQTMIAKRAGVSSLTLRRIIKEVNQKYCIMIEL